MNPEWMHALLGGILIGVAVSLMLLWNGQVAGVSGILGSLISAKPKGWSWRLSFIMGLIVGGMIMKLVMPDVFYNSLSLTIVTVIGAGLLVGFGTAMGSGCTSGHGVCGVSRLSIRSIVATIVFIVAGMIAVVASKSWAALL